MRPGDRFEFPGGRIVAIAVKHMGGRYSVRAAADGRALGYVIRTERATIFYSGDTNYFEGFGDVGLIYNPDITLLNINGHLHSTDAVRAALETHARTVIPLHFGAYGYLIFTTGGTPRDHEEMERLLSPSYHALGLGESVPLSRGDKSDPLP